jgi:hypothetical protein
MVLSDVDAVQLKRAAQVVKNMMRVSELGASF